MKAGVSYLILVGLSVMVSVFTALGSGRVAELEKYRADGSQILLDETHLRVGSGLVSIGPSLRQLGSLRRLVCPPWSATDFKLDLLFNDRSVPIAGYTWYPDEIQQWGALGDLAIRTTTIPLRKLRSVVTVVEIKNGGTRAEPVEIEMRASLTLDRPPARDWGYTAPESGSPTVTEPHQKSGPIHDDYFDAGVRFTNSFGSVIAHLVSPHPLLKPGGAAEGLTIAPGTSQLLYVLVVLGDNQDYNHVRCDLDETLAQNDNAWRAVASEVDARVPRLSTSDARFERFFNRSKLTLLTSRWDLPEFVTAPHYAEGGIDGRGICIYLWGVGYVSEMMALADSPTLRSMLERFLQNDLMKTYAYTPLSGEGIGNWYAYNSYNVVRAIHAYVTISGDVDFLSRRVSGKTVQEWVEWHALWPDPDRPPALVDYGLKKNILELERTDAYCHFVPSPNGERYASLRMAAQLRRLAGQSPDLLEKRALETREMVVNQLWDANKSWMASLDLQGNRQFAYSIQIFDLLRDGLFSKAQQDAILTHLNEREFLSPFGVHSLSKADPGYDYRDVDWGGPGVYAGDAPELVEDLAKAGYPARAEDLLRRILWWGDRFPYLPQAIRANAMDYRHDGIANSISGLAGAQSIVFGIFGVKYLPDKKLKIQPHALAGLKRQSLEGLMFCGKPVTIEVNRKTFTVIANGIRTQRKTGTALVLDHNGSVVETAR